MKEKALMIAIFTLLTAASLFISIEYATAAPLGEGSILYQKYCRLDGYSELKPSELAATMEAEIRSGKASVETYILLAIAKLAGNDVESYMRNVKKADRLRYYKFKAHPLTRYDAFTNRFVNVLRTLREINNRFEIYPNSSMLYYQTAMLCKEFSKKLAIENLKIALKLNRDFLDAHLKIAELYEECMDYNRAIEHWREIMDIRPYDFRPYYKICHLGSKFGNFTIARSIYELGMRKKMSLHEHKEFQQVIADLVAEFPRLASEREITAEKLLKLKEVVQGDPLNIDALLEIAETYFTDLSDVKNAEQSCVRAIHIDQLNYKSHLLYSKILDALGDVEKAYSELLFAISEGGEKIKDGYITELTDLYERKLICDMISRKLKINELVEYFSVYYNE